MKYLGGGEKGYGLYSSMDRDLGIWGYSASIGGIVVTT